MSRRLVFVTTLAIVIGAAISCTKPIFSDDSHFWGTYNACLRRVRDTCHDPLVADGGYAECLSPETATSAISIALAADKKTFRLARPPLSIVEGQQVNERFEVVQTVTASSGLTAAVCGCAVDVQETIRGELLLNAPATSACVATDGGSADAGSSSSCTSRDLDAPDAGTTTDWLAGGSETIDLDQQYAAIQGTILDQIRPTPDESCGCKICEIEYEFVGVQ